MLTSANISGGQESLVRRAFMLTDSADSARFVAFNESDGARRWRIGVLRCPSSSLYGGRPGVMVTVFFPGPVTNNVALSLNVPQNGAKQDGPPVACAPADGCRTFTLGRISTESRQRAVARGALPRFCAVATLIGPQEVENRDRIRSDT
jgi:hypothetical protein